MKINENYAWIFQIIAAGLFLSAVFAKFTSNPAVMSLFDALDLGKSGAIFIGILELISALLLLTSRYSALGGLLGGGIMTGASIAHLTVLGVTGDAFVGYMMSVTILISCAITVILRRHHLPFMGEEMA